MLRSPLCMQAFSKWEPQILCDLWRVWQEREVSSTARAWSPGTRTDFSRSSLPFSSLARVPDATSSDKSIIQGTRGGRFQGLPCLVIKIHQADSHSPQYNSILPKRTRSPTLTPASSNALVTPIFERVTCRRSMLSSLSWLVMLTVRSTRLPRTI